MNNEPMPSGCLSIEAAAQLLCITQNQLRKLLHELHWLEKKHGKNTATKLGIEGGFLKTQARGYPAPFNKKMTMTYFAPVITQHGIDTLMQQKNNPQVTQAQPQPQPQPQPQTSIKPELEGRRYCAAEQKEHFFNSATEARDEAMQLMNEWLNLDKAG